MTPGQPTSQDAGGLEPPSEQVQNIQEQPALTDAEAQKHYREEYLLQLRRQSCPGCGDDFSVF